MTKLEIELVQAQSQLSGRGDASEEHESATVETETTVVSPPPSSSKKQKYSQQVSKLKNFFASKFNK